MQPTTSFKNSGICATSYGMKAFPISSTSRPLTYLLFLKMMQETGAEDQLPLCYRWADLVEKDGVEQITFYCAALLQLGMSGSERVQAIFANAQTALKQIVNADEYVINSRA